MLASCMAYALCSLEKISEAQLLVDIGHIFVGIGHSGMAKTIFRVRDLASTPAICAGDKWIFDERKTFMGKEECKLFTMQIFT